ncbi:MAG: hypothetical protein MK033_06145 [Candidatus Caenarcaniphilales bacterium]|nr:hypothetical protein [Candidatus Caenarcaniphilales bacterium]
MNNSYLNKTFSLTKETVGQLKSIASYLGIGDSASLRYMILKTARELNLASSQH